MNRELATSIVLAEAFAENGLAMMAHRRGDAGFQRIDLLIKALRFLEEDLAYEDVLSRELVVALFFLSSEVTEDLYRGRPPTSESRCSLYRQYLDVMIAISQLVENWKHWPGGGELLTYDVQAGTQASPAPLSADETFEGYRVGDITYCAVADSDKVFPVRVIRLGFNVIEVEPVDPGMCRGLCDSFLEDRHNRCFQAPHLPAGARFGGFDERPVNAARRSGDELKLLPAHYETTASEAILQRHAEAPERWPLPTGTVFERWFKGRE